MVSVWLGSIHCLRSSTEQASSFFEKVQLHFQLPDLLIQFGLFRVGLLAHLLPAIAKHVRQSRHRLALPKPDLRRMHPISLRNLRRRLVPPDRLNGHLRLQARRMILPGLRHFPSPIFMPPHHLCLLYTSDAADEEDSVDLGG